ncbi:MAG: HupE/UreJ family protein [Chromatocurvus sp.]
MSLELDLMVSAGSREAYYALSRLPEPLHQPSVQALLMRMIDAIELEVGGSVMALAPQSIDFPAGGRDTYLDPFSWPRTRIVLAGTLPEPAADVAPVARVRFLGSFVFEEPIATTLQVTAEDRRMTRWLVPGQYSPDFDVAAWQGNATRADPMLTAGPVLAEQWQQAVDYAVIGFRHIIPGGIDHLLFVLGLCLGARSLRSLVLLITLFTLAHSLSLGAMALGLVRAPSNVVEPLILGSIVWVAIENLWRRRTLVMRSLLVLFFGLIHGLGFAGALRDIGLPPDGMVAALLAFNIGVEIGQLVFIVLAMTLLQLLGGRARYRQRLVAGGSLAIAAVATVWIVRDLLLI